MSSKIEWTEDTWNPITGCSKISAGCKNCYAERMAKRLKAMGVQQYRKVIGDNGRWNGYIEYAGTKVLEKPLKRKKPTMYFVNSMSDMFHERNSPLIQTIIWNVMEQTPQHTYQVLTKRASQMYNIFVSGKLPVLSNVWLGVSVEDNFETKRIEYLRKTPAAVRFVSFEPLLEDIMDTDLTGIDWVIVGAESGQGARSMKEDWVRHIRDICLEKNIRFFYKQKIQNGRKVTMPELDGVVWRQYPKTKGDK